MRAAIASPVPVLPDVGSMIVPPGFSRPSCSAASTIRIATRSLIEPPGLKYSTLATIVGASPAPILESRTSGVSPTVSRIDSLMSAPVSSTAAMCEDYTSRSRSRRVGRDAPHRLLHSRRRRANRLWRARKRAAAGEGGELAHPPRSRLAQPGLAALALGARRAAHDGPLRRARLRPVGPRRGLRRLHAGPLG